MKMCKEKNDEFPSREILYIKKSYEGFLKRTSFYILLHHASIINFRSKLYILFTMKIPTFLRKIISITIKPWNFHGSSYIPVLPLCTFKTVIICVLIEIFFRYLWKRSTRYQTKAQEYNFIIIVIILVIDRIGRSVAMPRMPRNTRHHLVCCRERGSHARGVYPTQYTSCMGTARVKHEEETDTSVIVIE